jgi:hypothetical protein
MTDTDPQTEAVYRRLLMQRSPEERVMMAMRMCEMARATVMASLPPDLSEADRRVAIFRRYYGNDFSEAEKVKIEQSLRAHALSKTPQAHA